MFSTVGGNWPPPETAPLSHICHTNRDPTQKSRLTSVDPTEGRISFHQAGSFVRVLLAPCAPPSQIGRRLMLKATATVPRLGRP